ncbi:MAG: HEPN domain-containing protein [Cyanobacteria bacterium]|nr:HEPN domain-containing protein [Cyanobacteriota bacterium]
MTDKHVELANRWLERSNNDIITARQTLLLMNGPTDTPCFHAQQAIEKTFKALLTFHQITFPRTHDLLRLLDLALPFIPDLDNDREGFADMESYAVDVRYPDLGFDPLRSDAIIALSLAEATVFKIREKVSKS